MFIPPLSNFGAPERGVAAPNLCPAVVPKEEVDEELRVFIALSRVGVPKGERWGCFSSVANLECETAQGGGMTNGEMLRDDVPAHCPIVTYSPANQMEHGEIQMSPPLIYYAVLLRTKVEPTSGASERDIRRGREIPKARRFSSLASCSRRTDDVGSSSARPLLRTGAVALSPAHKRGVQRYTVYVLECLAKRAMLLMEIPRHFVRELVMRTAQHLCDGPSQQNSAPRSYLNVEKRQACFSVFTRIPGRPL